MDFTKAYFWGRAYIAALSDNQARSYFRGRTYFRGNPVVTVQTIQFVQDRSCLEITV